MTKLDKAKEALVDCIEALKIQKANVEMQLSTQWEGVADAIGLRIEKAEIALAALEADEPADGAYKTACEIARKCIYNESYDCGGSDCINEVELSKYIQQYAEAYHERRLKEAQAIMDAEPRGMIASGIPGPMSLDAQLKRFKEVHNGLCAKCEDVKAAKVAVLEEVREMFNNLDEMNPVDYSDSFDVINTLIEDIKAGN
jgi:hypothetical protein